MNAAKTNHISLSFDAISENVAFARMTAAMFMAQLNPTLDDVEDVKTAVSEAVTNAIIHGYEMGDDNISSGKADHQAAEASDKPSETDKVINHIAMQQAFNSLDDSERRLIMLRYMQDKTQKQVAEVLGRNQVAISRMEKNTLAKLRRAMM